ncbi:hypothetical protein [Bradyrhizobium sp.]|uniref:hypothetical protein n=1 Tax=Bradyrhizobium sp. TaxID=376 RepID=UPI001ED1777D|nr:hypothetical protein [Bradyrhizobium sp.]MBV9981571.1 hypothetical protein [Bradyrhizobium sp.]
MTADEMPTPTAAPSTSGLATAGCMGIPDRNHRYRGGRGSVYARHSVSDAMIKTTYEDHLQSFPIKKTKRYPNNNEYVPNNDKITSLKGSAETRTH